MTSKPRKTMASKTEQLPEVPPVRDEAAELAAQLAATQESDESDAAPAAEPEAGDSEAVEGEIVPDDAPICGECFPGGWKRRNPAATMCSCRHGEWHRSAEG